MRWIKKLQFSLLISIIISLMLPSIAFAQEAYTYTVTLYAGNQGALTGAGIEIVTTGDDVEIEQSDDKVIISGLHYKDDINFVAQYAANVTNEKYYVSGIRKSGRDNSELELSSYEVTGDKDYVVAYAIRGNMVAYTVNYQDESGKALLESESFYGNVGEKPVIAYRYIEGYTPQAYNLTKTLSANEEENVFTFVYKKVKSASAVVDTEVPPEETTPPDSSENTEEDDDDRDSAPIKRVITIIRDTITGEDSTESGGNSNNAGDNQSAGGNGGGTESADGDGADGSSADGEGDTDSTMILDDDTPLSLLELSEEQVPLAGGEGIAAEGRPGTENNLLPIYAGIGIVAFIALLFLIIFCIRKKKKESSEDNNE